MASSAVLIRGVWQRPPTCVQEQRVPRLHRSYRCAPRAQKQVERLFASGAQLDNRYAIAPVLGRGGRERFHQGVMGELLANSGPQSSSAFAMYDAHGGHAGHGGVVEVRFQFLKRLLDAPAAHIKLPGDNRAIFQTWDDNVGGPFSGGGFPLAQALKVVYIDPET